MRPDESFQVKLDELVEAVRALAPGAKPSPFESLKLLPAHLPIEGVGEQRVMDFLGPSVLGESQYMDDPLAFAHMDPPTPWITWAATLWNARLNQNLLHSATAPVASKLEALVVSWLTPLFGMDGGHMVPGSTIANLTAIWAARELKNVEEVAAPDTAHISIEKAARLLGLRFRKLPTDGIGGLLSQTATDLQRACLVLVAGSTSTGVIDPLFLAGRAAWTHVDAAWAGPLRLSRRHAGLLNGIEDADSVSISAHKWLFQPKESALVLFRETAHAHAAVSFGGAYLAAPNIGLLGSHGAIAVPLLALLWAWGQEGMEARLDRCMASAERFASFVANDTRIELLTWPQTGIVVWRPLRKSVVEVAAALPVGLASQTTIGGETWFRCVAANPLLEVDRVIDAVSSAV